MAAEEIQTEGLIKEKARILFFQKGFLNATTQEIADEAGVNRALIHYYFRSREQMLEMLLDETLKEKKDRMRAILSSELSFRKKISLYIDVVVDYGLNYPYLENFIISETARNPAKIQQFCAKDKVKSVDLIRDQLEAEVKKKRIAPISAEHFMVNLSAMCHYPLLAKSILQTIHGMTDASYKRFLLERKEAIFATIFNEEMPDVSSAERAKAGLKDLILMDYHLQNRMIIRFTLFLMTLLPVYAVAQTEKDTTLRDATLERVIQYTLEHQPAIRQAMIDEQITDKTIQGKLADWFPQVNFSFNYQRAIDLQYAVFNGEAIPIGVYNTSSAQLNATQTIFNRDVLLASTTASKVRIFSDQNISKSKIDATVNVTKAFYDVLATQQQIKVNEESIVRLKKSLKDAYNRYVSGVADKTDYKRATILLTNAEVAFKTVTETLVAKQEFLETLMGLSPGSSVELVYDTAQIRKEIELDTLQPVNYSYHIDYKLLTTQRELQDANVKYSAWAFLPSLSAYGNYSATFLNNELDQLYDQRLPYSYVGATLTFPIFQGGKRVAKLAEQRYARTRIDVGLANLQSVLQTEYTRAMSTYKANLKNFQAQRENVDLAKEVYDVTQLQYVNGVRSYLDVTVAESDLRTARINYFNSLYQVLASKLDVMKALGQINY